MLCHIGSCQRHQRCMYTPCRTPSIGDAPKVVVISARQQGKTDKLARERIRAIAKGATINGTYRLPPGEALDAFRADLLRIVGE